jgi:hypothetical protein
MSASSAQQQPMQTFVPKTSASARVKLEDSDTKECSPLTDEVVTTMTCPTTSKDSEGGGVQVAMDRELTLGESADRAVNEIAIDVATLQNSAAASIEKDRDRDRDREKERAGESGNHIATRSHRSPNPLSPSRRLVRLPSGNVYTKQSMTPDGEMTATSNGDNAEFRKKLEVANAMRDHELRDFGSSSLSDLESNPLSVREAYVKVTLPNQRQGQGQGRGRAEYEKMSAIAETNQYARVGDERDEWEVEESFDDQQGEATEDTDIPIEDLIMEENPIEQEALALATFKQTIAKEMGAVFKHKDQAVKFVTQSSRNSPMRSSPLTTTMVSETHSESHVQGSQSVNMLRWRMK